MRRRDFVKNISLAPIGTPFLLNDLKFQTIGKPLFPVQKSAEDNLYVHKIITRQRENFIPPPPATTRYGTTVMFLPLPVHSSSS